MSVRRKNILVGSALTVATSALTMFSVSCQTTTKFDQDEKEKLRFASTFPKTGEQGKALEDITKAYNEKIKNNPSLKEKGYMEIETIQFDGGYDAISRDLLTKLPTKNKGGLYNLFLNYPGSVAILNKYDMALNLTPLKEITNSKGEKEWVNVPRQETEFSKVFDEKFLQFNDQIAALPKNGVYGIPTSRSSIVMSIDASVFSYIVKEAVEKGGASIKEDDKKWFEEQLEKNGKADRSYVQKIWGNYKNFSKEQGGLGGYQFSLDVFNTYEGVFDLSQRIKKSFPDSEKGEKQREKVKNVFGIDSMANIVYGMAFSEAEGDYSKFIFGLSEKGDKIDYNKVLNNNKSDQYKTFEKIYDILNPLIEDRTLFIKDKGEYSSNFMKYHQLAFSLSSSAGYNYNYIGKTSDLYSFEFRYKKNGQDQVKVIESRNNDYYIIKPTEEEKAKGAIAKLKAVNPDVGKDKKEFFREVYLYNDANSEIGKDKNNFQSNEKLNKELEKLFKENNESVIGIILIGNNNINKDVPFEIKGDKDKGQLLTLVDQVNKQNTYILDIKRVKSNEVLVESLGSESVLNKNELLSVNMPLKNTNNSQINIVNAQGPSLIGVHANKKENEATKKFINWFLNEKNTWKYENRGQEITFEGTALEYFAFRSGYVLPINNTKVKSEENGKTIYEPGLEPLSKKLDNPFTKLAFDLFNYAVLPETKDKYALYEDPSDSRAAEFRSSIDSSFVALKNKYESTDGKINFKDFLEDFKEVLGANFKR